MRISTIMPAHNSERYIAQALESVLSQSRPPDEIIVVDDGSTDGTLDALRPFSTEARIARQENRGIAHALNTGISLAIGDALAFLDCDDLWLPEKLSLQSAALSAEQDLEAVFGYVRQFLSPELSDEVGGSYSMPDDPQRGITKNALLIWRRSFNRIGPFDEQYRLADFVDWYARAHVLGLRWRMLPEVLVFRRQHRENAGRQMRADQHQEILHALKRSIDMRRASYGLLR
jgi:glycosyltransferase involved in cell wall biosynthesis